MALFRAYLRIDRLLHSTYYVLLQVRKQFQLLFLGVAARRDSLVNTPMLHLT